MKREILPTGWLRSLFIDHTTVLLQRTLPSHGKTKQVEHLSFQGPESKNGDFSGVSHGIRSNPKVSVLDWSYTDEYAGLSCVYLPVNISLLYIEFDHQNLNLKLQ